MTKFRLLFENVLNMFVTKQPRFGPTQLMRPNPSKRKTAIWIAVFVRIVEVEIKNAISQGQCVGAKGKDSKDRKMPSNVGLEMGKSNHRNQTLRLKIKFICWLQNNYGLPILGWRFLHRNPLNASTTWMTGLLSKKGPAGQQMYSKMKQFQGNFVCEGELGVWKFALVKFNLHCMS